MAAPFGATYTVGGPMPQGGSQVCNACGYALPSSKSSAGRHIGQACKQCGYVGFPNEPQSQRPVPLKEPQMARPRTNVFTPLFQPTHHSTLIPNPRPSVQQDRRGLEMSHVSSIGPNGQPQLNENCMGGTYTIPGSRGEPMSVQEVGRGFEMSHVPSIGPNGQPQLNENCMGATYTIPSSPNGYFKPHENQMGGTYSIPSSRDESMSVQQVGRGLEMSHGSSIGVPNRQPQLNENCMGATYTIPSSPNGYENQMGATYSIPSSRDEPKSVQQVGGGLEMSPVPSIRVPNGQYKSHENRMGATYSIPSSRVVPMPQVAPQICTACGHSVPSVSKISCKQCGYEGLPNVPQPQRPVPLQESHIRAPLYQGPPLPPTNVTAPNFQPIAHSTPIVKTRLPAQQGGRAPETSPVSSVGVPREPSTLPEHCLRCCLQPYAQGQQGGPWPPHGMYSGDPSRWQPEVCQRCCSHKVPNRAVAPNVPPTTPVLSRLVDSLEPATLGGNAGRGGGGRGGGNEFFLLDERSGKAERWNLLPSATYSFVPPQATSFRLHPAGTGRTQRAEDNSAVYVRLPHPSALSPSDATGPQLMRQAAMMGLSQRRDSSPALFVRLGPNAGNVAPHGSHPRAAREFQPPVTPLGQLALRAIQDVGDSDRELQPQSTDFLDRWRKHLIRMESMRNLPRYSEFGDVQSLRRNQPPGPQQRPATSAGVGQRSSAPNVNSPRATSPRAAASGRPLPGSGKWRSVSVSTQTGPEGGRPASPVAARDSQRSEPATQRELMQGSLRSILATAEDNRYSQSQRVRDDFSSD